MKLHELTFGTGKEWVKRLLRLVFFVIPTAIVLSAIANRFWDALEYGFDHHFYWMVKEALFYLMIWVLVGIMFSYVRAAFIQSSTKN